VADLSLSVIVPAYNAAESIARALDSAAESIVHARRELDFSSDLIVVDDGSEDDTLAVCAKCRPSHSSLILKRNLGNRGTAFCQNEGARLSRAQYLFFLHADDRFLPEHVLLCLRALTAEPSLGWAQTRLRLPGFLHPSWIAPTNDAHAINKCVKRVAHLRLGGFPEEPVFRKSAEDLFYSLLLKRYLKGTRIEEETVVYDMRSGNYLDRHRDWLSQPFDRTRNALTPEQQEEANAVMRRRIAEIKVRTERPKRGAQSAGQ